MFRIIIAGTRTFNNYDLLRLRMDAILSEKTNEAIEIVSGGASGADALGERYALEKGYLLRKFTAEWNRLGRSAGPIRNAQMADYADALVVFWDGKSAGTRNMIDQATKKNLQIRVIRY